MRSRSAQSLGSGFLMTSSAPSVRASKARPMPSPCTDDETTRIGVGVNAMIRSVASSPSILGMWMSIVTRSGLSRVDHLDRFAAVVRLPDDLDLRVRRQDLREHLARDQRVVDDDHADLFLPPTSAARSAGHRISRSTVSSRVSWLKTDLVM